MNDKLEWIIQSFRENCFIDGNVDEVKFREWLVSLADDKDFIRLFGKNDDETGFDMSNVRKLCNQEDS